MLCECVEELGFGEAVACEFAAVNVHDGDVVGVGGEMRGVLGQADIHLAVREGDALLRLANDEPHRLAQAAAGASEQSHARQGSHGCCVAVVASQPRRSGVVRREGAGWTSSTTMEGEVCEQERRTAADEYHSAHSRAPHSALAPPASPHHSIHQQSGQPAAMSDEAASQAPQRRLQRLVAHLDPTLTPPLTLHPHPTSSSPPPPTTPHSPPTPPPRTLRRAVIVTGVRTPFIKSFTTLRSIPSLPLLSTAVSALLSRTSLPPSSLDHLFVGNVVVSTSSPNLARELILDLHLPPTLPGTTITAACLSGLEAVAVAVHTIETGHAHAVIAAGVDSCSSAEMPLPHHVTAALGMWQMGGGSKRAGWGGVTDLLRGLSWPWTWLPSPPTVSERSTGMTMGQHADLMAEINGITREAQDTYAVDSHRKAAQARKEGRLAAELCPITLPDGSVVDRDSLIRDRIDVGKLSSLPSAFRPPPLGTVTAASSSALTDGASAVLVMSAERAVQLGYAADVNVVAYVRSAWEPFPQLLLAPALAVPRALREAGVGWEEVDVWEVHEAFAGQVLATLKVMQDEEWYERVTGRKEKVVVDPAKLNPNGGSIALGHPFAATGGRLVTSACNELRRRNLRYAMISICAAGGLGAAMLLERVPTSTTTTTATAGLPSHP